MNTGLLVTIGSITLAVALVVGWIVLLATGHKVDTEYIAVTTLAVGHAIGINTGASVTTSTKAP